MQYWILLLLLFFTFTSPAQEESEFRSPVGIPLYLSGTFAELRSNHFHGGIDIKTNGKIGYRIYAAKEGFISRIKVRAGGYGNALYIEHPNGYTTVYGHLHEFNDEITAYVKEQQYAKESFNVDLYLAPGQFPVERGEVIALSGNSGSSGGPHLHYEIRRTAGQIPINPLKFTDVKDNINPTIYGLRLHNLGKGFYQSEGKTVQVQYISPGNYRVANPIQTDASVIGLSVKAIDKLNGSNNSNGFYWLKLYVDDRLHYAYEKEQVSFGETRMLNAHIDYPEKKRGGGTYTNCFKLPGNQLNFIKPPHNDGRIWLNEYNNRTIRIEIGDYAGNVSTLQCEVQANPTDSPLPNYKRLFPSDQTNYLTENGLRVTVPHGALYDDVDIDYQKVESIETKYPIYSSIYQVHNDEVPLHDYMTVEVKQTSLPAELRSKAVLANMDERGRVDVNTGSWHGDYLSVGTRYFGTFFITTDTTKPTIDVYRPASGYNYAGHSTIEFKIDDDLSGIKSFRAEVDGRWVLMNYDSKNDLLYHSFDGRIGKGEHQLILTVTDRVGNTSKKELNFTR